MSMPPSLRPGRRPDPARHEAWQIRLAFDHFRWRVPIRPFRFSTDGKKALPGESLATHADPIAYRMGRILNEIEVPLQSVDDDNARRLLRAIEHQSLLEIFRKIGRIAVIYPRIDVGRRGLELIPRLRLRRKRLRRCLHQEHTKDRQRGQDSGSAQVHSSTNLHLTPACLCASVTDPGWVLFAWLCSTIVPLAERNELNHRRHMVMPASRNYQPK